MSTLPHTEVLKIKPEISSLVKGFEWTYQDSERSTPESRFEYNYVDDSSFEQQTNFKIK
ncbi:MAG: hypothetical protein ABGY95_05710 [Rubritalea sp.]|uniref:hypothetical protein n=1 Tax=Rubritalea sp. TaxID=2109375 RepID=UPI003242FBC4